MISMAFLSGLATLSLLLTAAALDNGVGRTPAMGWNSWNYFRCQINETTIKEVADAIVATGLRDAGYKYVNIDDCWMEKRGADGKIIPFASRFPSGMKALADYIHDKGLKFGVYSDTGNHTCEGYPGSMGYEALDAQTYAEWGVDYLKYDYCGMEGVKESVQESYTRMHKALEATGRPILFSLCSWGAGQPWLWAKTVGHSWRTGIDLFAVWDKDQAKRLKLPSFLQPVLGAVAQQEPLAGHAGPGGFNDPDMLVVGLDGMYPYGIVQDCPEHVKGCKPGMYISRERWGKVGGLTVTEQRTHFSFWCMMSSPLILGNDPRHMSKATLQILMAREVIAVNQDGLGMQATKVYSGQNGTETWAKEMEGGIVAVLLFNRGESATDIPLVFGRDLATWATDWARDKGLESSELNPCKDKHAQCKDWAAKGECKTNAGFMLDACTVSCPEGCPGPIDPPGPKATALVRDLWLEEDMGFFTGTYVAAKVEPHEARLLTIKFLEPDMVPELKDSVDTGVKAYIGSMKRAIRTFGGSLPGSGYDDDDLHLPLALDDAPSSSTSKGAGGAKLKARVRELEAALEEAQAQIEALKTAPASSLPKRTSKKHSKKTKAEAAAADDDALCSPDGTGCGEEGGASDRAVSRKLGGGGGGVVDGVLEEVPLGGWLAPWQAKLSVSLNAALVVVALLLITAPRRRRPKTSRDVQ